MLLNVNSITTLQSPLKHNPLFAPSSSFPPLPPPPPPSPPTPSLPPSSRPHSPKPLHSISPSHLHSSWPPTQPPAPILCILFLRFKLPLTTTCVEEHWSR
ncbi:hypothetical protein EGR_11268 [Echinococcus granulosus]|uniref:Uncharacterized protein n=1 Tax=Echinococcus granulosus TaxID=6210 RepID=W6UK41_ECHGR|nr:hypothetical protein EGR_11268 [Echinococcus granulosus]EUB53879.1 hypothetical protein EGR_11268 [Echinococcus granulosus]